MLQEDGMHYGSSENVVEAKAVAGEKETLDGWMPVVKSVNCKLSNCKY